MTDIPPAWSELIEALELLARHPTSDISPFHCEHDRLSVLADDSAFTADEIAHLADLGFERDTSEGGFYSFRYGSA